MNFEIDGKKLELLLVVKPLDGEPIDMDAFFCCPHCGKKMFEDGNFSIQRTDYLSEETGREVFKFRSGCPENRERQTDYCISEETGKKVIKFKCSCLGERESQLNISLKKNK